jgi:hypothetical protein
MPATPVEIEFIINDAQAKGELSALEAHGAGVKRALQSFGLGGQRGARFLNPEDAAALEAYNRSLKQTTETTEELGQASTDNFGQMGSMLDRIAARLLIMEAIRIAITEIGKGIKYAMDVGDAEMRFKNFIDTTEHGAEVFEQMRQEGAAFGQDFVKETEPAERILESVTDNTDLLHTRFTALSEVSKVYGVDLKALTTEYANLQETGTVSLQELIKLNEQLPKAGFKELIDQLKQVEAEYKTLQSDTESAEKQFNRQREATDRATAAQESFGEKVGLTQQVMKAWELGRELRGPLALTPPHGVGPSPPTTFAEYYHREAMGQPTFGAPGARAGLQVGPAIKALTDELNKGTAQLAKEWGQPIQIIKDLAASQAIGSSDIFQASRRAREEQQQQHEDFYTGQKEMDKYVYEQQKTGLAQVAGRAITGIAAAPDFGAKLDAVNATLDAQLGKLHDPIGQIMVNTQRTATSSEGLQALLSGGT